MTAIRSLLTTSLGLLLAALPGEAQQLAPLAVRASGVALIDRNATSAVAVATARDTLPTPRREISPVRTILGGVTGGVVGTFVGLLAGGAASQGCHGDMCQFGPILLGAAIGESIGLAAGAHVGSRSSNHGHVLTSAVASAGIAVAGTFVGAGLASVSGLMVPLTPALQLAAALAIESH